MRFLWVAVAAAGLAACGDAAPEGGEAEDPGTVAVQEFAANPAGYEGREITLQDAKVTSRLGDQAFWIEFPNEGNFLVKSAPGLGSVVSGQSYHVTGRVVQMSDSVVSAWEQEGVIKDEGQKAEAQYAVSFLEATRLQQRQAAQQ